LTRPEETSTRAERNTLPWSTSPAQLFQLFQPIGGVSAIWSPITIFNSRVAAPSAFRAPIFTVKLPAWATFPVICPVAGSSTSPAGRPSAENVIGRSPVAVSVNKNGLPRTLPVDLRAGDPRRVRRGRRENLAAIIRNDHGRRRGAVGLGAQRGSQGERGNASGKPADRGGDFHKNRILA
jgi:hypothetical protein